MTVVKFSNQVLSQKPFSDLISLVKEVKAEDFDQILNNDLGPFGFQEVLPLLEETQMLMTEFSVDQLLDTIETNENTLKAIPLEWLKAVSEINQFNINMSNPAAEQKRIISGVQILRRKTIHSFFTANEYLKQRFPSKEKELEVEAASKKIQDALISVDHGLRIIDQAKETAENSATAAQKATAETGFEVQSEFFSSAATRAHTAANRWLFLTVFGTIILIISVFLFDPIYETFVKRDDQAAFLGFALLSDLLITDQPILAPWVRYISTKVLSLASLAFLVALFRKNYVSNRHNNVVNEHRANALKTFAALAEASGTDDGRDLILQSAASCIFSHQETSYSKTNGGGENSIPQIVLNPTANQTV